MKLKKYCLVFIILLSLNTFGQSHKYFHYTVENGLPSLNSYKLFEDSKGNLWIGNVNGISKFDGYKFTNFTTQNGLEENFVINFTEDKYNRVWYLTYNGSIGYIENEIIRRFPFNNLILKERENSRPTSLIITNDNSIHIGYRNNNILSLNKNYGLRNYSKNTDNVYLYEFDNGFIYGMNPIESKNKSLTIHQEKTKNRYSLKDINDVSFICVKKLNNNTTLISFKNDVIIIQNEKIKQSYLNLLDDYITDIYIDNFNHIWFSTRFNGVYKYESIEKIGEVKPKNYYPEKTCAGIIQDKENGYWFSFIREGLFLIPSLNINNYNKANGLEDQAVISICNYKDGLLASTYYGKLYFIQKEKITEIHLPIMNNGFQRFNQIIVDEQGVLWTLALFNTGDKIILFKDFSKFKELQFSGTTSSFVYDKKEHAMYVTTYKNIYKVDKNYDVEKILENDMAVITMKNTRKGLIFSAMNGLFILRNNKVQEISLPKKDIIISIEESKDALWIAAQNIGIGVFYKDTVIFINAKKDLNTNSINKIKYINNNIIWVATSNGFRHISFNPKTKGCSILKLDTKDGLIGNDISDFVLKDSMMYIATNTGISYLNKRSISANKQKTTVQIKSLTINNTTPQNITKNQNFNYNENYLRINFIAISLRNSKDIVYRYKLKGLNEDWFYTKNTDVQYTNLEPGEYEFMICASIDNEIWCTPARMKFSISKPFWKNPLFFIAIGVYFILVIWIILLLRIKYVKKTNLLQQQLYLTEKKALSAQMNPHFIFNALGSIQNFLLQNDNKNADKYLSKFARLIRLILKSSRQSVISIEDEVKLLNLYLDIENRRFDNKFEYNIIVDERIEQAKTCIAPMILQPLIENSIWHGIAPLDKSGLIRIEFSLLDDYIVIQVEDNGVGLSQKDKIKKGNKSEGISIIEERIELMQKLYNKKDINIRFENIIDRKGDIEGVMVLIVLSIINN
jgi:ligand-binding sensor domain-containing protein